MLNRPGATYAPSCIAAENTRRQRDVLGRADRRNPGTFDVDGLYLDRGKQIPILDLE